MPTFKQLLEDYVNLYGFLTSELHDTEVLNMILYALIQQQKQLNQIQYSIEK